MCLVLSQVACTIYQLYRNTEFGSQTITYQPYYAQMQQLSIQRFAIILLSFISQYKVEGEKATRLFCALESHNATQRYVPQLITHDEEVTLSAQDDIEKEIHRFYNDLFKCKDNLLNNGSIEDFLGLG